MRRVLNKRLPRKRPPEGSQSARAQNVVSQTSRSGRGPARLSNLGPELDFYPFGGLVLSLFPLPTANGALRSLRKHRAASDDLN